MKVLRSTQIQGPSSYKKFLESIQYQDEAGTFKSSYQSTKTRLGCSKVKTQPSWSLFLLSNKIWQEDCELAQRRGNVLAKWMDELYEPEVIT
jgi:hypothetical protein